MKKIIPFLKPYRGIIAATLLLVAVSTMTNLLLPDLMSDVIDEGIRAGDMDYILACCGKMLAITLVGLAALLVSRKLTAVLLSGFTRDLRSEVFRRVNSMTFEEFKAIGPSALVTRSTNDVQTLSWVAGMASSSIITIPVLVIGGIALAMSKDVMLSLIMLVFVPLIFLIVVLISKNIRPLHHKSNHYIDIQNDLMRERLHGIRVIRAFNRESTQHGRIADATHIMAENIIKANIRNQLVSPVAAFLFSVVTVLILYLGGWRMENGLSGISGGDVFAIIQYISLAANGITMAAFALVMLPQAQVAAERIGEVFDAKGLPEPNPEEDMTFRGNIRLENLSFRYKGAAEDAISGISMDIKAGQKIAVIGGTGSGKSTLLQMLLSFRLPTEGRVYFDDIPADTINRKVIRKNISCVLQKTAIYTGSIRRNIAMGKPDATEDEIRAAADIAQLGSFIDTLPDGLDYELTQSGQNLSGGQKQRLCIARAILKDAPIYIFDDSFSALDFLTEANLRRELNEKVTGKTQIVITQRITSAMSSDCIYVMDKGRLVDCGDHSHLLKNCQIYREIYASQTGGGTK